jgi:hypothetical protein
MIWAGRSLASLLRAQVGRFVQILDSALAGGIAEGQVEPCNGAPQTVIQITRDPVQRRSYGFLDGRRELVKHIGGSHAYRVLQLRFQQSEYTLGCYKGLDSSAHVQHERIDELETCDVLNL